MPTEREKREQHAAVLRGMSPPRSSRFGTLPKADVWTVWSLDVWGNEEDGFEVNDRRRVGTIRVRLQASDAELLTALKNGYFVKSSVRLSDVEFEDYDELISVNDAKNGEPVLQLTKDD